LKSYRLRHKNYIGDAKKHWSRLRPYLTHPDLTPCIKKESSFSYPSGHSALSHYYMHILEVLLPNKKAAIDARADQIAYDRLVGGVHYPSDIRDGKLLGDEIYDYVSQQSGFKALLRAAPSAR